MLRGTLLAFVLGWVIWFWIDKSPAALGPLPFPRDGEFLHNFQITVDLLKQSRFSAAFVYVWKAHYLVLSLVLGLLLAMLGASVARARSRKRLIELYVPDRAHKRSEKQSD